ncbi:hypothetical protein [Endozoicomonas sp. Mp262]|uniref:hypothetical protein n=1 Tax=Endozoicomonas sp. Mp262 TaxID=2919499 RepID=UPI0021D8D4D2
MNIRETLLTAKLKTETVNIKQLQQAVTIREMDAKAFDQYEGMMFETDEAGEVVINSDNMKAKLIVSCVLDDDGELAFTPDDIDQINKMPGSIVKELAEACAKISGIVPTDDVEKN